MELILKGLQLPVRLRLTRPMNDQELLRFCAANNDLRIEREADGEILVVAPAGFEGSRVNQRIGHFLYAWAESDGRGTTTESSGGYTLADGSVRAPDAAWVSFKRLESLSGENRAGFATVCPEFVIELRSDSDRLSKLEAKMKQWIENGVEIGWLIDPLRKAVAIYRPGDFVERLHDPSSVRGTGSIAGFALVMAKVWG